PVAIAIVVNAEPEWNLGQKPRQRKARSRRDRIARYETTDRRDDLLSGLVQRWLAAQHLDAVGELHRRPPNVADRDHELDVARVLIRGAIDIAGIREHRRETPVRAEVGRCDRDRGPHAGERGHATTWLCAHGRAFL